MKNTSLNIILVAGLVLAMAVPGISAHAGQRLAARTREVTPDVSYARLLEENADLKREKELISEEAARLRTRNSALAANAREQENRVRELARVIEEAERAIAKEKQAYEKMIDSLEKELETSRLEAEKARGEWSRQDHVRRYNETRKDLMSARRDLRDLAKLKRSELAASERQIRSLRRENEKLKKVVGKNHFNLGTLLFKQGDHRRAVYEFEKALEVLPGDPDTNYNLAILYDHYMEDPCKARPHYEEYLRRTTDSPVRNRVKERIAESLLVSKMVEYRNAK